MDWKKDAITKLEQYPLKKSALKIIPLQIAEIDSDMTSIRSANPGLPVINNGSRGRDDSVLNAIVRKQNLESNLRQTEKWLEYIDMALAMLSKEEYRILERFFFTAEREAVNDLSFEMNIDRKTVYARKDKALRKFTLALYGLIET